MPREYEPSFALTFRSISCSWANSVARTRLISFNIRASSLSPQRAGFFYRKQDDVRQMADFVLAQHRGQSVLTAVYCLDPRAPDRVYRIIPRSRTSFCLIMVNIF